MLIILEIYDIIRNRIYIFFFVDSDNSIIESVILEVLGNMSDLSVLEDVLRDKVIEDLLNIFLIIFLVIVVVLFVVNIVLIIVDK